MRKSDAYEWAGGLLDEEDLAARRKYFGLARMKGGGSSSTTVNNSYQPTEGEKKLWDLQAAYANRVAPNAYYLNDVARGLIQGSLGAVQVDFNGLNNQAQSRINSGLAGMSGLIGQNNAAASTANSALSGISGQVGSLATASANQLGQLAQPVTAATGTTNASLANLANGELPEAYQQNMQNAISRALKGTVGQAMQDLGTRGVLNSSVTTSAMNDIEKNAADSVARQYQQNISQVAGLNQQQLGNTQSLTSTLAGLNNAQYSQLSDALGTQANLAQQRFSNSIENSSQNSGLYSNLLNSASLPIATAAAAQEAAQTPAFNAWNASLGLNSANTAALSGLAGKGTSTQTTTTKTSGGSFWGGLLGGVVGGAGNALGAGLWCFPDGTKIRMADGTEKKIERIEAGDKVASIDESGKETEATVIRVMEPHYSQVYNVMATDGHTMTTLSQPVMKDDGEWVLVDDLKMGTLLKNVGIVTGVLLAGERKVYDLETDGGNVYIADGFVAKGGDTKTWQGQR